MHEYLFLALGLSVGIIVGAIASAYVIMAFLRGVSKGAQENSAGFEKVIEQYKQIVGEQRAKLRQANA